MCLVYNKKCVCSEHTELFLVCLDISPGLIGNFCADGHRFGNRRGWNWLSLSDTLWCLCSSSCGAVLGLFVSFQNTSLGFGFR